MPTSATPRAAPAHAVPVSLQTLLSNVRHISGAPPESVVESGVACLNPAHAVRLRANLLDTVSVCVDLPKKHSGPSVTLAHVWPLYAVDDGYVAFDSSTLKALSLDAAVLPSCPVTTSLSKHNNNNSNNTPNTTPPSRRARRKRKGSLNAASPSAASPSPSPSTAQRGRDEQENDALSSSKGDSTTARKTVSSVSLGLLNHADLTAAQTVRLKSASELDNNILNALTSSEPFEDTLHARLHGRIIMPGMIINAPLLGMKSQFLITSVDNPDLNNDDCEEKTDDARTASCVSDSTQVLFEDANKSKSGTPTIESTRTLLDRLGGVEEQLCVLKLFLREALQLGKGIKGESPDRKEEKENGSDFNRFETIAKGVLLYGPMGSGKTALAVAVAQWADAHVEILPCASLFATSDPGNSASRRLQTAFARIKRRAPGILILDDVDAIAPKRDAPDADATRMRILAILLKLLDDMGHRSRCAVLATTTNREILDAAMRRPGRLDIEIEVGIPSPSQRASMLLAFARHSGVPLSQEDADTAASGGHGHVAADLASAWRNAVANSQADMTVRDVIQAVRGVRPSALREVWVEVPTTRWTDVGGKEHAKQRLREAVEWPISRGRLLQRLGIRPPSGVLLFGPPGCSKTLLARAVATECGANFISIKGAELLSKYVGDSEKAVRKTFERARAAVPCVIFFDEVDALASERSATVGSGVHGRVVAQLLHEMDGIDHHVDQSQRVIVIAATNRPDCLDKAFLRAGRIDIQVYVGLPDAEERLDILRVHTKKTPLAKDIDLEELAHDQYTYFFSGAEIAALVREAGLCAMERDVASVDCISRVDFESALLKVKPRTSQATIRYFEDYVLELEQKKPG